MPNKFSFKSFEVMLRAANAEPPLYCSYGTVYSVLREGDDEYCILDDTQAMQWVDSSLFIKTGE